LSSPNSLTVPLMILNADFIFITQLPLLLTQI
jgi:hypothetical protein